MRYYLKGSRTYRHMELLDENLTVVAEWDLHWLYASGYWINNRTSDRYSYPGTIQELRKKEGLNIPELSTEEANKIIFPGARTNTGFLLNYYTPTEGNEDEQSLLLQQTKEGKNTKYKILAYAEPKKESEPRIWRIPSKTHYTHPYKIAGELYITEIRAKVLLFEAIPGK